MANINVIQSTFSFGELSPLLYAQANFDGYQKGVKSAQNCLTIPQGGFRKRWGTNYVIDIADERAELSTFGYDIGTQYLFVWTNNSLNILLENISVATVVTTYPIEIVQQLYFVPIQTRYIIFQATKRPRQLIRTPAAANIITGVTATPVDEINVTTALTVGNILPITFTTAGTLPTTSPQIYVNTTYFALVTGANSIRVYPTSADAAADTNRFFITAAGAGVSNVIVQNVWTLSDIPFSNLPAYDFDAFATYSAAGFTFQVSAVVGTINAPTTITSSAAVFTAAHVGGLFTGGGGVARIIGFTNNTNVTATTYLPFTVATGAAGRFAGADSFLGEPAWSDARGWPSCGAYHQERLAAAATRSIPNGLWLSTLFQVYDFDDSEDLDTNSISDYSAKTQIIALSSTKSLIVHCDQGIYSTSLTANVPLTPRTFNMDEQNPDGINLVQPVFIDNQIIYVDKAASNVKNMAWDIVQSSYVNTNISIQSSHIPSDPIDMATFSEPFYTDGLYVFIVNRDGTLAIYQTLLEQNINAWTPAISSNGFVGAKNIGSFKRVATIGNRAWFIIFRPKLTAGTPRAITGYRGAPVNTLSSTAIPAFVAALAQFTTIDTLPDTVPPLLLNIFYYIKGVAPSQFAVYSNLSDALNDVNRFTINSAGLLSNVVPWFNLGALKSIEELDYASKTDFSFSYSGAPVDSVTFLPLAGFVVQIVADGNVLPEAVAAPDGTILLGAFYSNITVGLQITAQVTTLPLSMGLPTGPNLYNRKHIRTLYVQFYQTASFMLQGYPVPAPLVNPVVPTDGIYSNTIMEGWDGSQFNITISQTQPIDMTILGIGYNVEV